MGVFKMINNCIPKTVPSGDYLSVYLLSIYFYLYIYVLISHYFAIGNTVG